MKNQLVTVCIFCLLCATHSHCSSDYGNIAEHHVYSRETPYSTSTVSSSSSKGSVLDDGGGGDQGIGERGGLTSSNLVLEDGKKISTESEENSVLLSNPFISVVFEKFGDGKTLSPEGFENLLRALRLSHLIDHNHQSSSSHGDGVVHSDLNLSSSGNNTPSAAGHVLTPFPAHSHSGRTNCVSSDNLLGIRRDMNEELYKAICPILLYQYLPFSASSCSGSTVNIHSHSEIPVEQTKNIYSVWMYATLSIIVISLCGLGGVVVIPVMQKVFYQKLLQFLVALAVGTLCGDALLHLLPHAMLPRHSHTVSQSDFHSYEIADSHDTNMWRGLVAMFGVIFLYFTEKGLTFIADWRKRKQRKKQALPKVRVMRDLDGRPSGLASQSGSVGEKLCKHKYSSYPYCYGEITDGADIQKNVIESREGLDSTGIQKSGRGEENGALSNIKQYSFSKREKVNGAEVETAVERELLNGEKESELNESHANDESFTIIIREHENAHHGHSHQHGHVHAAPTSLSSVAWMVVMGDGLHNFADGMAIGAAFATNIPGGFSTALAVFFHELPHELGDFAVLLQAGMSAKQAVFYNLLSSVLCFIGMCLGVFLGHDETTTQWVFSAAAGMFLYIALVDMIPELTSSHSKDGGLFCQCALHFAGLMSGVGTMLLIALYERDLKLVFKE